MGGEQIELEKSKQNGNVDDQTQSKVTSKDEGNSDDQTQTKVTFLSTPDINFDYVPEEQKKLPNEPLASWITLGACFLGNIIYGYHVMTFGIYYVAFTEAFDTTKAVAGTVGALHGFFSQSSGLLASVVIKFYGCKVCSVTGALLAGTGLFLSSFAFSIYSLHVTHSFLTGIGIGFIMLPNLTVITQTFNKHRAFATSFATLGISLGNLSASIGTTFLIQCFGWRGALRIHSGLILNTLVFTLLWSKPLKENQPDSKTKKSFGVLIKNLFDFSIMRNPYFLIYVIGNALIRFNLMVYVDQTPSRLVFYGYDLLAASFMMSYLHLCGFFSRSTISAVLRFCELNPLALAAAIGLTQGAMSLLVSMSTNYYWVLTCTLIFGFAQGGMMIQCLLSLVKIGGVATFARTRAVYNMFIAIMILTPTPISGWIFDVTQNYNFPFLVSGTVGCSGGGLMVVLGLLLKSRDAREKAKQLEAAKETLENTQIPLKQTHKAVTNERVRTYTY